MSGYLAALESRLAEATAKSGRSQQVETGASDLLGCRAAAVLRLNEVPRSDGRLVWQATVGTAVHAFLEAVAPEGAVVEQQFAWRGVKATVDCYDPAERSLTDYKTASPAKLATVRRGGPSRRHQAQVAVGGMALAEAGHPVDLVRLAFLPRDGQLSDGLVWEHPLDDSLRALADEAADWAETVAALAVERRGDEPWYMADGLRDEPVIWCRDYCPWVTACRGEEQPSLEEYAPLASEYAEARAERDAAAARMQEARDRLVGVSGRCGDWKVSSSPERKTVKVEPDVEALVDHWRFVQGDIPPPAVERVVVTSPRVSVRRA